MAAERWRVVLDTSGLMIAGLISPTGAARKVLRLYEARVIETLVSKQVLTGGNRNLSEKLPGLRYLWSPTPISRLNRRLR
jgi:predicted nucleic acid-binding protein